MTRRAFTLFSLFLLLLVGCDAPKPESSRTVASASPKIEPSAAKTAGNPVTLRIAYGSEKKTWLEEQAAAFTASRTMTRSGRPVVIQPQAMGSGEAASGIVDGTLKPHVFSPASTLY